MTYQRCTGRIAGALLAVAVGAALAFPAHASLIAYDSFSYAAGTPISGQGTNANWPTTGQKWTQGTNHASMETPGSDFNYHGLAHAGNVLDFVGGYAPVFRQFGATYNTANNIYWFSVVMDVDKNPAGAYAGLSLFNTANTSHPEQFFIGQDNLNTNWSMELSAITRRGVSGVAITPEHAVLLVVELNGKTDTASLFVNPTPIGGSPPATPSATFSIAGYDFSFNEIRIGAGAPQTMDADEFRFGTTFADVTPTDTPAPASWMTFCFALVALAFGRGRFLRNDSRMKVASASTIPVRWQVLSSKPCSVAQIL